MLCLFVKVARSQLFSLNTVVVMAMSLDVWLRFSSFALLRAGPVLILIITFVIPLSRLHSTPKKEGTDFHLTDVPHSAEGMSETKHSFT